MAQKQKTAREPDSFTTYVLDQLSGLGPVESRRLFSGQGLYWRDQIFALIHHGRVYFRVSERRGPATWHAGRYRSSPCPGT
jgi:TfoX/Sxy family transcriptional regulator of competence genes